MDCINERHQVIRHESEKPCKIDVHFTLATMKIVATLLTIAFAAPYAWAWLCCTNQVYKLHETGFVIEQT